MVHRPRISPVFRDLELMRSERPYDELERVENVRLLGWIGGKHQHHPAPTFLSYSIAHRSASLSGHAHFFPKQWTSIAVRFSPI